MDASEHIVQLLGAGISATATAEVVGCDISYVSQIAASHAEEIQELRSKNTARFLTRDELLEKAEQAALEKTAAMVPFITRPAEAARVYSILNGAKRALAQQAGNQAAPTAIVNLTLSVAAVNTLTRTPDNQVIEVNGRSMIPLPSKNVAEMLKVQQTQRLLATKVPASLVSKL